MLDPAIGLSLSRKHLLGGILLVPPPEVRLSCADESDRGTSVHDPRLYEAGLQTGTPVSLGRTPVSSSCSCYSHARKRACATDT